MSVDDVGQRCQWIEAYDYDTGEDASRTLRVKSFLTFPWIVEMERHPNVLGALRDLMGSEIMTYLSGIWSKPPGQEKFVSWHQDGAYYALDRDPDAIANSVTAWVALLDAKS